jgi:hypothetical protein
MEDADLTRYPVADLGGGRKQDDRTADDTPRRFDDYPPLKRGEIKSDRVAFEFTDITPANRFFKPMVREQKFDVTEMAVGTIFRPRPMASR